MVSTIGPRATLGRVTTIGRDPGQLTLTLLAPTGSGSGTYAGDPAGSYDAQTQLSVEAVPAAGSVFDKWVGNQCGGSVLNPALFTMLHLDITCQAQFLLSP